MSNIRMLVQYAVPVVTGIIGLLWYFGRKKGKKSIEPSPKRVTHNTEEEHSVPDTPKKISVEPSGPDIVFTPATPEESAKSDSAKRTKYGNSNSSNSPAEEIRNVPSVTAINYNSPVKSDNSITHVKADILNTKMDSPKTSVSSTNPVKQVKGDHSAVLVFKSETSISPMKTAANGVGPKQSNIDKSDLISETEPLIKSSNSASTESSATNYKKEASAKRRNPIKNSSPIKDKVVSETDIQTMDSSEIQHTSSFSTEKQIEPFDTALLSAEPQTSTPAKSTKKSQSSNNTTELSSNKLDSSPIRSSEVSSMSDNHQSNCSDNVISSSNIILTQNNGSPKVSILSHKPRQTEQDCQISNCELSNSLSENPKKTILSRNTQVKECGEKPVSPSVEVEDKTGDSSPPSSESPGCDSNSEASNDSGRGGSVTEHLSSMCPPELVRYEFNFPSDLCGRLIGRSGKNINSIKEQSSAMVSLQSNPFTVEYQICVVEGTQAEVEKALSLIRQKFPRSQFSQLDMSPINRPTSKLAAPVLLPNIMQLSLPEGVSIDVVVSSIVDAGHVFIQQPTHPSFPSLSRLSQCMMMCYSQDKMVPPLPQPIEVGVICVAPVMDVWYRAQVVQVYDDLQECDVKFVDYGGFDRIPMFNLKQIRSDFMTLPFQAVECYISTITPLPEEEYYSDKAASVLEELTQGKVLQAQVVSRAEDGVPFIHLYQISGNRVLFINRELVNRKVVKGIEIED